MTRVGIIKGSKIARPKNAQSGQARLLQVQIGSALQTVQLVPGAGEDVNPQDDAVVVILEIDGVKLGVATFDGITPTANEGERRIYAYDSTGNVLGRIKFKANGKVFIGNAGGNLRTQLDNALTALNTFSGAAAQAAITAGGSSSVALAAAIVALMAPLFTAVVNAQTAIDAVLDTSE